MAIQFHCPACSQPIEVDDEWASRSVACPYCRTTVTAPQASTFVPPADAPMASPAGAGTVPAGEPVEAEPPGNALAVWALVLSLSALLLNFLSGMLFAEHVQEFADPQSTQKLMERMQAGDLPSWFAGMMALGLSVLVLWLAGIVCGIIAVTRPARRGLAIGSLVVSGIMLVLFCLGLRQMGPSMGG